MGVGSTARKPVGQQVAYCRVTISGVPGNQTAVTIGTLPAGANILRCSTMVRTVFAGGTPTISFGTLAAPAVFFALATAPATTLGRTTVALLGVAALSLLVDTVIVAGIGGSPTSGDLDAEVEYTMSDATP